MSKACYQHSSDSVLGFIYIKPKTRQTLAYNMSDVNSNELEKGLIILYRSMCFTKILCCQESAHTCIVYNDFFPSFFLSFSFYTVLHMEYWTFPNCKKYIYIFFFYANLNWSKIWIWKHNLKMVFLILQDNIWASFEDIWNGHSQKNGHRRRQSTMENILVLDLKYDMDMIAERAVHVILHFWRLYKCKWYIIQLVQKIHKYFFYICIFPWRIFFVSVCVCFLRIISADMLTKIYCFNWRDHHYLCKTKLHQYLFKCSFWYN